MRRLTLLPRVVSAAQLRISIVRDEDTETSETSSCVRGTGRITLLYASDRGRGRGD